MTQLIGFKRYGEEYKMMGLSSYGKPKFKTLLKENLFINQNLFELNIKFFNHAQRNFEYSFSGSPEQNSIFNKNIFKLLGINESAINKGANLYISDFWELKGVAVVFFKLLSSEIEITL